MILDCETRREILIKGQNVVVYASNGYVTIEPKYYKKTHIDESQGWKKYECRCDKD